MANLSEAYDFSLFEDRTQSALPIGDPKVWQEQKQKENIVELPQQEPEKAPKPKRHPFKMTVAVISFLVIFGTVISIVNNQVILTELTEDIHDVSATLAEEESLEVQLTMQASEKMNGAQIEEYVQQQLGMSKITEGQVTYLSVSQEDKGTVVQDLEGGSILDQLFAAIRSWFA